MPRAATRDEVIAAVRGLPRDRAAFVGIDGPGGAGKSELAAALAAAEPRAVLVPTDDLQGPGVPEWDWPRLHASVIAPLAAGRPGRYLVWRWGEPAGQGWRVVPAGSLLVIEGVSATRREFAVPWDLTIWVDTPVEVRRARTLVRDGPDALELWRRNWWPSEEAYIAREQPAERVDLIVSGVRD